MSKVAAKRRAAALGVSMTTEETLQFMQEKGLKPFDLSLWKPRSPLLVVFREELRAKVGRGLPADQTPSVVRLEVVSRLDTKREHFMNAEGWNNYYAIDPVSKMVRRVKVGFNQNLQQYFIEYCSVFFPDDTLFIPGNSAE